MSGQGQTTRDRVLDVMRRMFPRAPLGQEHYADLLIEFWDSGFAAPHMINELEADDDGKFWSYTWEAMLYRHLRRVGLKFREAHVSKSGQHGPDFAIEYLDQIVWIEAVAPAPDGIPHTYLFQKYGEAYTVPHEAVILRWTSAIADKAKKFQTYRDRGVIGAADCTVIAVNACRLSDYWGDDNGISQLPMALEAVFPIGPLAVPISRDGKLDGEPIRTPRYDIRKPNNASVPTTAFLDPGYAHVSAVLGSVRKDMWNPGFPLTLVHNPLASNQLPRRILGATREFVADEQGVDQFVVRPLEGNEDPD